jgi:hypothetical protein
MIPNSTILDRRIVRHVNWRVQRYARPERNIRSQKVHLFLSDQMIFGGRICGSFFYAAYDEWERSGQGEYELIEWIKFYCNL